ncbi:condensation domain-containing protein [Streptomyces sp. M10(2022)]
MEVLTLADQADEAAALDATRAALGGPLDLAAGRVWRVALAAVPARQAHVLRVFVHHIAFDGWSESVLADELGACYAARLRGRAAELPVVPGMAARSRIRERQADLHRAELERQLAYWKDALAGTPDLVFPEVPVPSTADGPLRRTTWTLPAGGMEAVDALAARHGSTRFAMLLTLYDQALGETAGAESYAVGFPVARRWDASSAAVIDCCVESMCVRMPAETRYGNVDFGTALKTVAHRLSEAFAAGDTAFADIVRAVNPPAPGGPRSSRTCWPSRTTTSANSSCPGSRPGAWWRPTWAFPPNSTPKSSRTTTARPPSPSATSRTGCPVSSRRASASRSCPC